MFSPLAGFADYGQLQNNETIVPPEAMIFCPSSDLLNHVITNHAVTPIHCFIGNFYLLSETENKIGIMGKFGIGAPAVVAICEEFIAWGVKRFIIIGTAGTLQKHIGIGDIVVCERAIRDEGTSYHYIKPSKYAYPSKKLTKRLEASLDALGQGYSRGTSWTTDAPFRETIAEARQYQKEEVATVEMEASALFAVAQYRNVEMGAMFTISDSLADLKWSPHFHHERTKAGLETLYKAAVGALFNNKK